MRHLRERLLFLRAFASHPRLVGALLPTSRRAVRDMLDLADLPGAHLVVELGAGTGVYTQEILSRLRPDGRVLALEIDPSMARQLAERLPDPRLRVACDSAERLGEHLSGATADVVVSALPFTSLGAQVRRAILGQIRAALAPGGEVLVLQYSPLIQSELGRIFPSVRRRISLLNVPPAFLFACTMDPAGASPAARPRR